MCLYPCQYTHSTGLLWMTNASDYVDGFWICLFWRILIRTSGWIESGPSIAMPSICKVHYRLPTEHCPQYKELPMLCSFGEFDCGLL